MKDLIWNKVQVRIETGNIFNYIADDSIEIGDTVSCETSRKGWVTGEVIDITERDRNHLPENKKIVKVDKTDMEEVKMLNQMFSVVKVLHNSSSREGFFLTSQAVTVGDVVVYADVDVFNCPSAQEAIACGSNLHVGEVKAVYAPGKYTGKGKVVNFLVDVVSAADYVKDVLKAEQFRQLRKQLQDKQAQFQERQMYAIMAQVDPEAKALLDKMDLLTGQQTFDLSGESK